MKKLMIAAILMSTMASYAEMVDVIETKDGKIVTNKCDAVEYAKEYIAKKAGKTIKDFPFLLKALKDDATIKQCDDMLSENGCFTADVKQKDRFSKCFKNTDVIVSKSVPNSEELLKQRSSGVDSLKIFIIRLANDHYCLDQDNLKWFLRNSSTWIKKQLRAEGKSFVEKDGVNPVQERVDLLIAAMNAKRMAGFNDAMKKCGMDFGIDYEALLLPESEIQDMAEKIYDGERSFGIIEQRILRTHLGLDEYNKFVKRYNDGE